MPKRKMRLICNVCGNSYTLDEISQGYGECVDEVGNTNYGKYWVCKSCGTRNVRQ